MSYGETGGSVHSAMPWTKVELHFDQALELDPQARECMLTELQKQQPQVVHDVRMLLAEIEELNAAGFLIESPPCAAQELLPTVLSLPAQTEHLAFAALQQASMAGKQVGAYTIDRLLGCGGMGEVWLASRSDGRFAGQCAIKFLTESVSHPKFAERFRREGGLLARLGHANIARLLDAGATSDGKQFLVLEYVDGVPIDQYCDLNELSVPARVRLFLDVVAAVAHAHSQLIVHRDLKPSNVLVTREGIVKLLDFGIAKLLSSEQPPSDSTMTRAEEMVLTPEYAAPEQLLGEIASTATDVYQLGLLLYVLLAGGHPLQLRGSRADRIKGILTTKLPRASDFATGGLRKHLRGDLDAILSMALNPDPLQRYPTAAALREELVRYLNREPVSARRDVRFYGARKFISRHRMSVAASALAVGALCGTLIFALAQARIAASERDHAFALASRNEEVTDFLGTVITEAAESDKPVTVTEMLARSEKLALADISGSPENRAAVLAMIGERYGSLDDNTTAARLFEKGLALLVNSHDDSLRAQLTCLHSYSIASLGRIDEAVHTIEHELEHLQGDPKNAADCLLYRSFIAAHAEDAQGALRYGTEGLGRLHAASRVTAADEGLFLGAIGWGYHLHGRNREADEYYRRAIQKYADLGREASANAISVLNNWALVLDVAGTPKRALELYDRGITLIAERNQGTPPPPYIVGNRARALESLGRYQEARADYEIEVNRAAQQHNAIAQAQGLSGLASTAQALHDSAAAADYVERVTAVLTPDIPRGAAPWRWRAVAQGSLDMNGGRFDAAREQFTGALSRPNTATGMAARLGKSEAELRAGDPTAAQEDAQLALGTATTMQGDMPYSNLTGLSWLALGRAQLQLGNDAEARHALERAADNLSNTVDDSHPALLEARNLLSTRFARAPGN